MPALEVAARDAPSPIAAAPGQPVDAALDAAWDAYCRWDAAAVARKRRLDWSRALIFLLLVAAAVGGVLASQWSLTWAAGIAAGCSAAAALLSREVAGPAVERLWLSARAAAETLKSEAFKYAAGAAPYDGADKGQRLLGAVAAIQADSVSGMPFKAAPDDNRGMPHAALNQDEYLRSRLDDQTSWYEGKGAFYNRRAGHWRVASLLLGLSGAVISGIAAADKGLVYLGAWVGVTGTLGGIVAAHVAGSRFSSLAQTYELTARRLQYLRATWKLASAEPSPAKWSDFVLECESTISAEREQWMKEWQRQIATAETPAAGDDTGEKKPSAG